MTSNLLLTTLAVICLSVLVSVQGVESIAAVPADLGAKLLNAAVGEEIPFDFEKNRQ